MIVKGLVIESHSIQTIHIILMVKEIFLCTVCRYKLEHNQISRSEVDKGEIFDLLNLHLEDPDQEIQHTALQLIQVSCPTLYHVVFSPDIR